MDLTSANIKLTLEPLDNSSNIPSAKPSGAENDLLGANLSYAINSIPTAEVAVPVGSRVNPGGSLEPSWFYKELKNAVEERKPYAICLNVDQGMNTTVPSGKSCIFKGYVTSIGMNLEHGAAVVSVGLTHWLADLDIFSILNRLSSPENSGDVSTDPCFDSTRNSGLSGPKGRIGWNPGVHACDIVMKSNTVWDAILTLLSEALGENQAAKEGIAGSVNGPLFEKVSNALKAIDGSNTKLAGSFNTGDKQLAGAIGNVLSSQMRGEFYSVTLWQKLLSSLLPQFYLSILPAVNKAYIVPDPGLTCKALGAREIIPDDTVSMQYNRGRSSILGNMVLVSQPTMTNALEKKSHVSKYQYPEETKAGIVKSAYMPDWLSTVNSVQNTVQLKGPYNPLQVQPDAVSTATNTEKKENSLDADKLCKNWVKGAYVNELTKGNRVTITTQFDPFIMLGSFVKVTAGQDIITEKDPITLYGIVQTATHTIRNGQYTSTFTLSNVRDDATQESIQDLDGVIYNNQPIDAYLYEEV